MDMHSLPLVRRAPAALAAAALIVAGLAGATGPAAAAPAAFCADGSQPMATVAEVEAFVADTPVTGLSVVQGTTPSPFTGKYLGYIDDGLGKGKDMLLFQLSSPVIDGTGLKAAGIWAGMSGSPVYASDGSLIGAVSYSLNYDNLPIAGVTPAEYMKSIGSSLATAPAAIRLSGANVATAKGLRATSAAAKALDGGGSLRQVGLSNVATSSAQGTKLTNALLARIPAGSDPVASRLRSKAFNPVAASAQDDAPLVAGGNVAAFYSTGDALIGGIGTVTAICGNDVWAFGHPMDFAGATTLGMANASAALILPDATGIIGSYKQVRSIGAPLGTITQDRLVGIKGSVGAVTGYPVTLTVRNAAATVVDERSSTVIEAGAGPDVAASLVGNAVIEDLDNYYSGTVRFGWAISYRTAAGQTGTLKKWQIYAASDVVAAYPATDVGNDLFDLVYNDFTDVEITDVTMNLTLVSENALVNRPVSAQYKKGQTWVSLSGRTLKPGTSYSVRAVYRQSVNGSHGGSTVYGQAHTVTLSKKAITKGSLTYAAAADESACDPEDYFCDEFEETDAESFDDLIDQLATVDANNAATQTLVYKRKGSSTTSRKSITAPGVVEGSAKVRFTIR